MIEFDLEINLEAFERVEPRPFVTVLDQYRFLHPDEALEYALLLNAGGLQQEHERTGAAVHDRHLARGDLHAGIVDPEACEGRQQVLDGGDTRVAGDQRGAERGVADILGARRDIDRLRQIDAAETDAAVGRRGPERHHDFLAGVQADASGTYGVAKGALAEHVGIFRCQSFWGARLRARQVRPARAPGRFPAKPVSKYHSGGWGANRSAACETTHQSAWRRRKAGISSSSSDSGIAGRPSPTARWRTIVGLSSAW